MGWTRTRRVVVSHWGGGGGGVHMGWATDKGSGSLSSGGCTRGGQETRGVVVSRGRGGRGKRQEEW